MKDLTGKIAVVTGGGSGIGEGMVMAFAEAGMDIVVADIELSRAEAVAERAKGLGRRARAVRVDVTSVESVTALANAAYDTFGKVHLLCNNAGVLVASPILDLTEKDWRFTFDVNVFGVVNGINAFVPRMLKQGGEAHIVNTASMASFQVLPNLSAYVASKQACRAITECLRAELAGKGIGVSGLYPGGVATNIDDSQRNRSSAYGPARKFELFADIPEEQKAQMVASALQPIEVGRLVRQAVIDGEPWIFTHPEWLLDFAEDERTREIKASRDKALARRKK